MHGKISFGVSYFGAASRASIESAPARPLSVPLRSRTRVDLFVRTPKRTSSSARPAHFVVMFNAVTPRIAQDVIEIRSAHPISALVSSARILAGNPAQSRIQPQACPVTQASPSEKRHSEPPPPLRTARGSRSTASRPPPIRQPAIFSFSPRETPCNAEVVQRAFRVNPPSEVVHLSHHFSCEWFVLNRRCLAAADRSAAYRAIEAVQCRGRGHLRT